MTDAAPRMIPPLDDLNREFWTGGASGELRLPRCTSCGQWVFPLAFDCRSCGGPAAYQAVSGKGTVFTYTTNSQPYNPVVPLPYNVSIVELDEQAGLRFTTNVVNCPPEDVHVGMPVRVVFEQQGEVFVPVFEPDVPAGGAG